MISEVVEVLAADIDVANVLSTQRQRLEPREAFFVLADRCECQSEAHWKYASFDMLAGTRRSADSWP